VTEPLHAVFLSYASQAAQRIAEALRGGGINVFLDQSELRGGDAWDQKIRHEIHDCALFVPVISRHTQERLEGYFRREWRLAVERSGDMAHNRAFLVPVVIDDTSERGASVPEKFHELQWTRLPGGETPSAFVERIQRLLSPEVAPTRAAATPLAPGSAAVHGSRAAERPLWRSHRAVWAIGSVLAVGLAAFVITRLWSSKHAVAETAIPAPPAVSAAEKSIAVLPFVDLSEKHDQGYFADGLAEEILDFLAKIPGLKVIGRTSSFQFRGTGRDIRKIGAELGAANVVEGSVRKLGDRIRITVQLVNARDGTHRWSESYDRDTTDTLSLQREIATAVARQLQVSVSDYFGPGGTTKYAEAYDFYLRGIRDVDVTDRESELRAIAEFSKAVEIDPAYGNAWVGLADAYDSAATDNQSPRAESYRLARSAVDKAIALDPANADAYAMRAFIRMNVWDWSGADEDIGKSLSIRKTSSAIQAASKLATARGNLAQAEGLLHEVLALDPLDTYTLDELAFHIYPSMGRYEDADRLAARLRDIDASYEYLNANQSWSALAQGQNDLALRLAESEKSMEAKEAALAIVYTAMHKRDKASLALERLLQIPTATEFSIASVYAYLGDKERAFQHLEKAYTQHSPDLLALKTDPTIENLRTDARYKALLHRMNLPE
jgi:TolB-like protein/tetratricopeptide (TPR) repeat protein